MALHRLLEIGLHAHAFGRQARVEGVELEEVAMPPHGRARTAQAGRPQSFFAARAPAGSAAPAPSGKPVAAAGMSNTTQCTQVILGAAGIGRVGIVDDERQRLRARRNLGPRERRREVLALAGVAAGDLSAVLEAWGGEPHANTIVPRGAGVSPARPAQLSARGASLAGTAVNDGAHRRDVSDSAAIPGIGSGRGGVRMKRGGAGQGELSGLAEILAGPGAVRTAHRVRRGVGDGVEADRALDVGARWDAGALVERRRPPALRARPVGERIGAGRSVRGMLARVRRIGRPRLVRCAATRQRPEHQETNQ